MTTHRLPRSITRGVLALGAISAGCGSSVAPGPTPTPAAAVVSPAITAITPNVGSTGGGTTVRITGTGFQPGASVTIGDERRPATIESSTSIQFTTPARDSGAVDVIVTNASGQTARLAGAYTYASPQSFDFNGTWQGLALAHPEAGVRFVPLHSDMEIRFTIQNNQVTSVTCSSTVLALTAPPSVSNGEFSYRGSDDAAISGRIVSATSATGTIDTVPCPATRWTATKQ